MSKRPITPTYILFYILFLPDTWQVVAGIIFAWLLTPRIIPADMGAAGAGILGVMLACIGYVVSTWPAKKLSAFLRRQVLKSGRK